MTNLVNGKEVDFIKVENGTVRIYFKDKTFITICGVDIFVKDI